MHRIMLVVGALALSGGAAQAQMGCNTFGCPFGNGQSPSIYSADGRYLGNLNSNPYDPNSVANPYGRYGSRYSPDSINNPYGLYGSPYSPSSVRNRYSW